MKLIGALTEAGIKSAKKAPFYSAVDEALAAIKRPKGTGAEFYTELTKQAGVKKAELADRKLEQAFKAKGKMTKEEAQQVLKDNPPPKLQEKLYDESTAIDEADIREAVARDMFDMPFEDITNGQEYRRVMDEVYRRMDDDLGTKFGKFKTKGGENYREILLKLPKTRPDASNYTDPAKYDADLRAYNASGQSDYYHPNHFTDDANIVAHMRVQDRMIPQPPQKGFYVVNKTSGRQSAMFDTPEELQAYVETLPESIRNNVTMAQGERKVPPKKVLHVEEIQSDWHQAGRKKGYQGKDLTPDEIDLKYVPPNVPEGHDPSVYPGYYEAFNKSTGEFVGRHSGSLSQEQAMRDAVSSANQFKTGVPNAPFKKNWHELAMKRLLNYAADNGYDSIAITPGAEQASRYDLSKQVDELLYKQNPNGTYQLSAQAQGRGNMMGEAIPADKLEDYVGKEVAQKIIGGEGKTTEVAGKYNPESMTSSKDYMQSLSGIDLQVGGEGMKGFYDKMLPDYLNNFGKPYGAQVESTTFDVPVPSIDPRTKMTTTYPVHSFPITPEMRESIKQKGLPLYQQVGIPTAGAGAASQMLEPEEEAGLATGGVVKSAVKQAQLAKLAKMREEMAPRAEAVKALIARDQNRYLDDVVPNSLTNAEIESEIKRMAAKAPMIMKPSALTELRKIVQQEKGDYGSRRVERAADEIPNLDKLYKEQALKEAFTGDNARALMTMNPKDFGKYAMPLDSREHYGYESQSEYIDKLAKLVGGFNDVPFLEINKREQGAPKIPFISGHEGRHRSRALESNAEPASLVRLLPRSELREPFPRRSQEEYIDALKQELEMTGNKVIPEKYFDNFKQEELKRPPIILPDIYAKGGAVKPKVKEAKGGRVRMTKNRDTMFMELSNKKLKRK
jgi:hypothetical protein